jgi:hypothetical protein
MRDLPPPPLPEPGPEPAFAPERSRAGRGAVMPNLLTFAALGASGLALVLALVALAVAVFRSPLGAGLSKYDFTTPRNALKSQWEMQANRDIRASLDLDNVRDGPQLREKIRTFEVKKEAEWKGTTILFVSYERKGVKKYEVVGFEKDASSGYWLRSYFSRFDLGKDKPDLARDITSWETKGEMGTPAGLGPPGGFGK